MAQLLENVDPDLPTIITGDFNATRDKKAFDNIVRKNMRFAFGPDSNGTYHNFHRSPARVIDHILVSKHFDVIHAEVVTKKVLGISASDHWPIVAELRLNTSVIDSRA